MLNMTMTLADRRRLVKERTRRMAAARQQQEGKFSSFTQLQNSVANTVGNKLTEGIGKIGPKVMGVKAMQASGNILINALEDEMR